LALVIQLWNFFTICQGVPQVKTSSATLRNEKET